MSEYIDENLYILIPVLYALGAAIKKSRIKDWLIPYILGGAGILLSVAYLLAVSKIGDAADVFGIIFAGTTQGVLCASASVYTDNLIKQAQKRSEDGKGGKINEKDAEDDS